MTLFWFSFAVTYLLLVILAAWRLSHDFAYEDGPGGVYVAVRRGVRAWVEAQIDASPLEKPEDHPLYWLYVGIECPRCLSFGVSLAVLVVATSPLTWPLALWWGIAGAVTWLGKPGD